MKAFKFFPVIILFWLNCVGASAVDSLDPKSIVFKQISLKEGLSQSAVYDICQDNLGYMWFATADGLNRYDGTKFKVYRHEKNNSQSLLSNSINSLYIDSSKSLWICTDQGFSWFDQSKNTFENFRSFGKSTVMNVSRIFEYKKDQFLVATSLGLFRFSKNKGYEKLKLKLRNYRIVSFIKWGDRIVVGGNGGLHYFDPSQSTFELVHPSFNEKYVLAILPDIKNKQRLWVGTEGDGLMRFDASTGDLEVYSQVKTDPQSISCNYIRSLCFDSNGKLWVGTLVGLNIFDESNKQFYQFFDNMSIEGAISQNSIRSIFRDVQGGMWCGTYFGGVNYYHSLKHQFEHIHYIKGINSLNDDVVNCMLEDKSGKLWIGTNDKGLNLYDRATGTCQYFASDEQSPNANWGNNIKSLLLDPNGNLFVGTHGDGLNYLAKGSNVLKRVTIFSGNKMYRNISVLQFTIDNKLWVGTLIGLFLYDPKTNVTIPFESVAKTPKLNGAGIKFLSRDSKNRLWIGFVGGVALYDERTNLFRMIPIREDLQKNVLCFRQQKNNRIWVGTSQRLYYYDEKKGELVSPSGTSNSLDYSILGIEEDRSRNLWLSTNRGLIYYSPVSGERRLYTESDGLQSNEFSPNSSCKTTDGKIFFGGINGITSFMPEKLVRNPYTPAVIIDNLTVFNKAVTPGDETGILKQNISVTQKIRLNSDYFQFGLEFIVPNYSSGDKNVYSYRLEGFDKEWVVTEHNVASYSNLNPGTYFFKIKAANSEGKWSTTETVLEIEVLPAWYKTWWAILLFGVVFFAIGYVIVRIYLARLNMRRELALERINKERSDEMNKMKTNFFINISHEFRTPLTLILSPLQEIVQKGIGDQWLKDQLDYVQRNAQRMSHLIDQVLDFQKVESGALELKVSEVEVVRFTSEVYDLFSRLAMQRQISYQFDSSLEAGRTAWIDSNFVEIILVNLISNAFKNTPEAGVVRVELSEKEGMLAFGVSDTGCGIDIALQEKIFDQFYQVDVHMRGTGIGLSLVKRLVDLHHGEISLRSEIGKGAFFTVLLPLESNAYGENEKNNHSHVDTSLQFNQNDLSNANFQPIPEDDASNESNEQLSPSNKSILIVEDDHDTRNYLISSFSPDFIVYGVGNGAEALEILSEEKEIDLIISDVMMPVMDGVKLCKSVKQNLQTCHIPIILLTAKSGSSDQLQGLTIGADDYLSKPFLFSILKAKVLNLFKARERLLRYYTSSLEIDPEKVTLNVMDQELLRKAIGVVEKELENPDFMIDEFSRQMNMSRSNLHIKLKGITGESPIEFIKRIRFARACSLLALGRYSIAEISTMTGFNSPSYFTTSFKKYMGCLPTDYQKNH